MRPYIMSDFLNDLDPNTLRNALRELTRRVGLLEAQMRPPLVPNGQMEMGDDGISVNDLGYGMQHETVYNTAYRRMRFGMFGAVTGNPAAATWDYYGDTGQNWLQMSDTSGWTYTTPANTSWNITGLNPILTISNTANVAYVTLPAINVQPNESYLLRLVADVTTSSGTLAAKISYVWKNAAGGTISTTDGAVITGATSGTYTGYTVAVAPAAAATLVCAIYGSSTSGSSTGTITYWFDSTLSDYCRIKKVTDLWNRGLWAASTWWTKTATLGSSGTGSWGSDYQCSGALTGIGDTFTLTEYSIYLPVNQNVLSYQYKATMTLVKTGAYTLTGTSDVLWYDRNRAYISTDNILTSTTAGTSDYNSYLTVPSGAFYCRLKRQLDGRGAAGVVSGSANFGTSAVTELFSEQLFMQYFMDDRPNLYDGYGVIDLGLPYIHLQDQKTAGTDAGTFTTGAKRTRTLNTIVDDTHNLTYFNGNQFFLPVGVYRIIARAPAYRVDGHQISLYEVNTTSTVAYGGNAFSYGASSNAQTDSTLFKRLTVTTGGLYELQHQCDTTYATSGLGKQNGNSNIQVYAEVWIWKEQ